MLDHKARALLNTNCNGFKKLIYDLILFMLLVGVGADIAGFKVDIGLPGKGNSDSHGARPVH